jgi:cytochrome c oxidase cbb3-type subunit 4
MLYGIVTILLLLLFVAVWAWAWQPRLRGQFEATARLALDDHPTAGAAGDAAGDDA